MIFWILAGLVITVCSLVLLRPLWRRGSEQVDRADFDITVYRAQLREVKRDRERGLIDPLEADAAEAEIGRRILAIADSGEKASAGEARFGRRASEVLVVFILLFMTGGGLGLYYFLGSPGQPGQPLAERLDREAAVSANAESLIQKVRERLEREPDDAQTWLRLARLLRQQDNFDEAMKAYRRAEDLTTPSPQVLGEMAETLIIANDGTVVQEARELFARVLEQTPGSPIALYYAGLALSQDGRLEEARSLWSQLAAASPPNAPWLPLLRQQLSELALALGEEPDTGGNVAQFGQGQAAPAGNGDQQAMIREMVAGLASRLEEDGGDLEGWLMLARSYRVLEDWDAARAALERAETLLEGLEEDDPLLAEFERESRILQAAP